MKPIFFSKQSVFRKWLEKNHEKESALVLGFYKVGSGKESITWPQSVDEALCFGWIDGVRTSIDKHSYQIRFSPRKANSIWSAVNIQKVEELSQKGLMKPAGLLAFNKRKESRSKIYSHEIEMITLSALYEKLFRANKKAWAYFEGLANSYKKASINWVMSAKQEATQIKRLNILIKDSEAGTNQWKDHKYNGNKTDSFIFVFSKP